MLEVLLKQWRLQTLQTRHVQGWVIWRGVSDRKQDRFERMHTHRHSEQRSLYLYAEKQNTFPLLFLFEMLRQCGMRALPPSDSLSRLPRTAGMAGPDQSLEAGNSMQVSAVGGRGPNNGALTAVSQGVH